MYTPLARNKKYNRYVSETKYLLDEAFSAGSHERVLKLLNKILYKRLKGKVSFDLKIPFAFRTSTGEKIRSYRGFLKNKKMIYINFLLLESDYIDSFYIVNNKFKVIDVIQFDPNTNIVQVINTITDYLSGKFEDADEFDESVENLTEGAAQERQKIFNMWLQQSENKNEHFNMLSTEKPANIYKDFILTMEREFPQVIDSRYFPTSNNFVKMIREFAKSNGIANPYIKFRVARRMPKIQLQPLPIGTLPEDQPVIKAMANGLVAMSDWKAEFEKLEKKVDLMIAKKTNALYGILIYGTGGIGKSYYINQKAKSLGRGKAVIIKDVKNVADFRNKLFAVRNYELLILDDADKVIQNKDMCTLLKTALDDTVGDQNGGTRFISLPPGTGKTLGDPGIVDLQSEDDLSLDLDFDADAPVSSSTSLSYAFHPDIAIITNSDKVAEPALWTRFYKAPLYLTKEAVMEKIVYNSSGLIADLDVTKEEVEIVADYIVGLIMNEDNKIADDQLSFRLFKAGLSFVKEFPLEWRGMLNTELLLGVTLAKDIKKTGKVK